MASVFNSALSRVKNCLAEYQRTRLRPQRWDYFASLNDLAQAERFPPVKVFYKDTYIHLAEKILRGEAYLEYRDTLSPWAERYVENLSDFEESLHTDRNTVREKLSALIKAHEQFIDVFTPIYSEKNPNRLGADLVFPKPIVVIPQGA